MSHYEERLQRDLTRIQERVVAAGRFAEQAVGDAVGALLRHDNVQGAKTALGDHHLNREIRDLDRMCHAFIARHLPSAGHLRFVSSVLRINIAIERIGDYAVTVARETVQLSAPPPEELGRDIEMMAEQSRRALTHAIDAFEQANPELARGTIAAAKQVDTTLEGVFGDLAEAGDEEQRSLADLFALLVVLNRLDRVGDQAKNICEETIFAETGETKAPKTYRVVFVDEHNDAFSVIAAAIARKAFPESGSYSSASLTAADALDAGFVAFMNRHGHAVEDDEPRSVAQASDDIGEAHVLVGLGLDPRERMSDIAYHTVALTWEVPEISADLDRDRTDALLEESYKRIAASVEELMTTLQGAEAG